ncbi:MAG: hypothetical protein IT426_21190 [Pirellulales bacterium]|nr:hypothetical protein [Pirellulales bacterium]
MALSFDPCNVQPADILFYRSNTWIGKAIRKLDSAEVSHAGLHLGNGIIGEALMKEGLTQQNVETSIQGCEWVRAFRMKNEPASMQPVLDRANFYLANKERYAFGQILLLAMICMTRKLDLENPLARRLVKWVTDKSAAFVRWAQDNGKQPMICSEFVYRSYDEAVSGDTDPYTIEITLPWSEAIRPRLLGWRRRDQKGETASHVHPDSLLGRLASQPDGLNKTLQSKKVFAAAPESLPSDDELDRLIETYLDEQSGTRLKAAAPPQAFGVDISDDSLLASVASFAEDLHAATDAGKKLCLATPSPNPATTLQEVAADFVTPGDLFRSKSLTTIGELRP